jgi:hypothetical protein
LENPSLPTHFAIERVRELWNRSEHKSPMTTRPHKLGGVMKFRQ